MCEADHCQADQVVISKGDFACLQAINLTNSTTGDLVFMGGTKFLDAIASLGVGMPVRQIVKNFRK